MVLKDRTEIPAALRYAGVSKKGLHVWVAAFILPLSASGDYEVCMEVLPARTEVQFSIQVVEG